MGSTSIQDKLSWWHFPLRRLYQSLALNDTPKPADLIFVHAGRMERKRYALELYRAGAAPRLLLSIGRFEVSRMRTVDFGRAEELIALRDRIAPDDRNFFCEMNASGIYIEKARLRRCSTYGEVLALREFLKRDMPRSLIVVSTDVHLRRVAVAFDRVFRDAPLEVHYCPVPAGYSSLRRDGWWARGEDRRFVLKEMTKLAGYRAILCLPEWMIRRLMRLKDQKAA